MKRVLAIALCLVGAVAEGGDLDVDVDTPQMRAMFKVLGEVECRMKFDKYFIKLPWSVDCVLDDEFAASCPEAAKLISPMLRLVAIQYEMLEYEGVKYDEVYHCIVASRRDFGFSSLVRKDGGTLIIYIPEDFSGDVKTATPRLRERYIIDLRRALNVREVEK